MLSLFLTKPFCYADTTEPKSTAIFYASQPPVELLGQYQRVVVEPDNITAQELAALHAKGAKVFAYLSIGEVNSTRKWYKQVDPDWIQAVIMSGIAKLWIWPNPVGKTLLSNSW